MSAPERIVPDETERGIVALHAKRYEFALPFCADKDVLDAGCGVGYGSAILAHVARRVVGVDRSREAIAYARRRYSSPNLEFSVDDLLELAQPDDAFDVVCAFESIEHLPEPEAHLAHVVRVLRDEGVYIGSTPRVDRTTLAPENPHHSIEFSRESFERLLRRYFDEVELYGQRRLQTRRHRLAQRLDVLGLRRRLPFLRPAGRVLLGTAATAEVESENIVISPEGIEHASELVAVCRSPRRA
jgi:SAM-dependent methyltransferase